jgi:hypothetical protein
MRLRNAFRRLRIGTDDIVNIVILLWIPQNVGNLFTSFARICSMRLFVCPFIMVVVLLNEPGIAITLRNWLVSYLKSEY